MRKPLVLLFVFALIATACSGSGGTVATVNGTPITLSDIEALSPSGATVEVGAFNDNLRNLIVEQAVIQAAQQQWGVVIDEAAISARYDELVGTIEGDVDTYLADNNITAETLRHVAIQRLLGAAIDEQLSAQVGPVSDADLQVAYAAAKQSQSNVCAHHILVDTEDAANAVIDRIDAGELFEDVATEVSTDTGSGSQGGDLGCNAPSAYVPTFADAVLAAPVGEVYGPVQSDFGYHVIRVDSREVPSFDDLKAQLEDQVKQQQGATLFSDWITTTLDAATIEVAAKYGTWAGAPDYTVNAPA